jgi:hypothetical protein
VANPRNCVDHVRISRGVTMISYYLAWERLGEVVRECAGIREFAINSLQARAL